jgi:hypothetical protein
MNQKKSIALHSSLFLLTTFLTWLADKIELVDLENMGKAIGHLTLTLLTLLLTFAFLFLLSYIISTKPENVNQNNYKKTHPLIRLHNKIKYPRYIEMNNHRWKVSKNEYNNFELYEAPVCPNCCKLSSAIPNFFDGYDYKCTHCKYDNFDAETFYEIKFSITNILNSEGLKGFDKVYKKPC